MINVLSLIHLTYTSRQTFSKNNPGFVIVNKPQYFTDKTGARLAPPNKHFLVENNLY